MEYKFYFKLNN